MERMHSTQQAGILAQVYCITLILLYFHFSIQNKIINI